MSELEVEPLTGLDLLRIVDHPTFFGSDYGKPPFQDRAWTQVVKASSRKLESMVGVLQPTA